MPPYQLRFSPNSLAKSFTARFQTTVPSHLWPLFPHTYYAPTTFNCIFWKCMPLPGKLFSPTLHLANSSTFQDTSQVITPSQNLPWLLELSRAHLCFYNLWYRFGIHPELSLFLCSFLSWDWISKVKRPCLKDLWILRAWHNAWHILVHSKCLLHGRHAWW